VLNGTPGQPATPSISTEEVLRSESLEKDFRGIVAVNDVSVGVSRGELLGIIGPNGAGKTTLFNLIAGALQPTSGKVYFRDRDITRLSPHKRLRIGIARTFQLIHPFASLTVFENIMVAATGSGLGTREARRQTAEVVDRLGMNQLSGRSAGSINAVEGKRLEIARAIVTKPTVLLLDEVFSGLNSEEVAELAELVEELRQSQVAIMLIEHNVGAIRRSAQRMIAMAEGRIISQGTPEVVLNDPAVVENYIGTGTRA
jgi:branched-chain amino acid transport system ATP-binding protein